MILVRGRVLHGKKPSFDSRRLGYSADEGTHSVLCVSYLYGRWDSFRLYTYMFVSCRCVRISVRVFSELKKEHVVGIFHDSQSVTLVVFTFGFEN